MKKKRGMAVAAALTLSMAMSVSALAASPSDISGHWAKGTITQWTSKGYISGYPDGTFKPDNSITRAEFVVLVNKAMGYTKKGNAYFRDVNTNYWGYDEIQKGVSAGYVKGDPDGSFRPNDSVTRQEAAVMISKILDLETNFTSAAAYNDYRYIPSWSVGYVGAVSNAKIMAGYPDGSFKADRVLSRAEAVIALDKVLNYDGKSDNKDDDKETKEDYTLEKTSLKDMTIKGDLVISSSLKSKAVSLDNVTVKGTLIVKGGGTITADDCDIKNLEMNYADATFKTKGDTEVKNTTFLKVGKLEGKGYDSVSVDKEFSDKITIDASINEFTLDAETDLRLLSSTVIKSFTATKNADRATINFSSAEVKDMDIYDKIKITGKGDIKTMTVYVSGVTSSIKPDDLNRKNGADKPDYTSSSSSSGSSSSSKYDNLTTSKDKDGGKYNNVKVTAGGVDLSNMTIYGNLTIDEDVADKTVTLDDVTIKGNVYVEGGGDSSIKFKDCDIEGDIYARKDYKNDPVALKFDSYSSSHLDGTIRISKNGAIIEPTSSGSSITINKVRVETSNDVKIKTNVNTLDIVTKNADVTIDSGRKVDKLNVSNVSGVKVTNNGTIKNLSASASMTVNGEGSVENKTGSGTVTYANKVTGVALNKDNTALNIGATEKLIPTITPSNATNKAVTWKSSDTSVATVGTDGTVKGIKAGTATITVTTQDGGKTADCTVTVNAATKPVTGVSITSADGATSVEVDSTLQLTANITPSDATNKTVTWSADNSGNATVDQNGLVTGKKVGEATITATTADGDKKATLTVNVTAKAPEDIKVTSIEISSTGSATSVEVEGTLQLTATVTPDGATNKVVKWSSSDTEIATVDETSGLVTGVAQGSATITATAQDGSGVTGSFPLTVTEKQIPIVSVTIESTGSGTIEVGGTETLTAKISPDNTTADKTVEWSITEGKDFVTISNSNGSCTVTGKAAGTAKITAKVGEKTSDAYTVTVNEKVIPIESVTGLPTTETIEVGKTTTLTATVNPSNTTESKAVTWTSSDPEVATVSNGTVTGMKAGKATITATAGDKTATCTVTVEAATIAVTGVTLSPASATLVSGDTITLIPTISPEGATNTNVTWNSSNTNVATVDSNGAVTVVGTGTADITVTTADGGKTATCSIMVTEKRIEITGSNSVAMGSTATLTASVKPDGMTTPAPAFTWSSSNTNVATVSGGIVTPVNTGTATITAKATVDNKEMTGTFDITVTAVQ